MKHFSQLLFTIITTLVIVSACKKKTEDSPSPSNGYRIDYYTIDGNNFDGKIDLTYNSNNQLIQLISTDNAGQVLELETYTYNNKGLKSSYKDVRGTDITTYQYEYNSNDLISKKYYYSGNDLVNPTESATYYYDSDNNMIALVRKNYTGSLYKDSSIYEGFTNGRPTLCTYYNSYSGAAFTLSRKEKYTYDGRMNLLVKEETKDNNITTFFTSKSYTYTTFSTEMNKVNQYTEKTYDQKEYGLGNNQDFMLTTENSHESTCNTSYGPVVRSTEKVTTTEFNANNLFSKLVRVTEYFDGCSNLTSTTTNTFQYYYEKY